MMPPPPRKSLLLWVKAPTMEGYFGQLIQAAGKSSSISKRSNCGSLVTNRIKKMLPQPKPTPQM